MIKNILGLLAITLLIASCNNKSKEAGTLKNIDMGNNEQIEVYKYYYDDWRYVYVARFKDSPNVVSTTWQERHGKSTITQGNVVIYENDSIQVVLKQTH
jgi:uncharacterized lipoprotein NlpE involved in copper resistance